MWKTLQRVIGSKGKSEINGVDFDGVMVYEKKDIGDRLNKYFVYGEYYREIPDEQDNVDIVYDGGIIEQVCRVQEDYLDNIFTTLKLAGCEGVLSCELLKDLWGILRGYVSRIVNRSLESAVVPTSLKVSCVVPVPKVMNSCRMSDYRPVNILPILDKVLESIILDNLLGHIAGNNILSGHQSGFRERHSTETAVQIVVEDWKREREDGKATVAVFLDFKRAFETIDRARLLGKLNKYGVRGELLSWLGSYLSNRKQYVKIKDVCSDLVDVKYGVPQGSKLGPLLFILYINDMTQILNRCKIHLFADDTLLYLSGNDLNEIISSMNEELEVVAKWLRINKLMLNVNKTKCMYIGNNVVNGKVVIDNVEIGWVDSFKYLGVIMDNKLNFKEHAGYITKKLAMKVGVLARYKNLLSVKAKKVVYNTIIMPHITYCSTILFIVNKSDLDKMQVIINRAMRIMLNRDRYARIGDMLLELDLLTVENTLYMNVMTFIYRLDKNLLPQYLCQLLCRRQDVHSHGTRYKDKFYLEFKKQSRSKKSIFDKGISMYNELPERIINSGSIKDFRAELLKEIR